MQMIARLMVFPDDTFLVSYPKSGNTWTRFLIGNLLHRQQPADYIRINEIIPDPEISTRRELSRAARPRIIKSHQYFDPRYRRVIYIVRDPRDVVVSQYHFHRKRRVIEDSFPLEKFASRFVAGETCSYGSWGENVSSWLVTRYGDPGFLLLRYEDMVADTCGELGKIARFLDFTATPQNLADAVERSSPDRMRTLEQSQAHLFSSTRNTRQDIPFVRAAKAGGWRSALPEAARVQIEAAWGSLISFLGYDLVRQDETTVRDPDFTTLIRGGPVG